MVKKLRKILPFPYSPWTVNPRGRGETSKAASWPTEKLGDVGPYPTVLRSRLLLCSTDVLSTPCPDITSLLHLHSYRPVRLPTDRSADRGTDWPTSMSAYLHPCLTSYLFAHLPHQPFVQSNHSVKTKNKPYFRGLGSLGVRISCLLWNCEVIPYYCYFFKSAELNLCGIRLVFSKIY